MRTPEQFKELRIKAETACATWVATLKSNRSKKSVDAKFAEVNEAVAAYNKAIMEDEYEKLVAMYPATLPEAIKKGYATGFIRIKQEFDKDSGAFINATIEDDANKKEWFNLLTLEAESKKADNDRSIMADADWHTKSCRMLTPLNYHATLELGGDASGFFRKRMPTADMVGGFDGLGGFSPDEKTLDEKNTVNWVMAALQLAIDAIYFVPTADNTDRNAMRVKRMDAHFLRKGMTQVNANTGKVVNRGMDTLDKLIFKALHRIATDGEYEITYSKR